MTTEEKTPETPGADEEKNENTAPESQENAQPETKVEEGEKDAESVDSLPSWAQGVIRDLRSENARRRTEANDLKDSLGKAKSPEDFEAFRTEQEDRIRKLERDLSFEKHTKDLDPELREFVIGETDDEIKASADKLREVLAKRGTTGATGAPTGGLDPKGETGNLNPRELAQAALSSRRRGR